MATLSMLCTDEFNYKTNYFFTVKEEKCPTFPVLFLVKVEKEKVLTKSLNGSFFLCKIPKPDSPSLNQPHPDIKNEPKIFFTPSCHHYSVRTNMDRFTVCFELMSIVYQILEKGVVGNASVFKVAFEC